MADLWEVLYVSSEDVILYSPRGKKMFSIENFIQSYDPSFIRPTGQHKSQENYRKEVEEMESRFWSLFMSEGWEPYSVSRTSAYGPHSLFFRRKYQG